MINTVLSFVGIDPIPWLRSSATALWAVILIGIWRATPYYMVIFLAGLQAIPADYYDAAKIDGAGTWGTFRYITLPLLRPTMLLVIVMNVIVAMEVFAVPMIMTGGGPADSTRVLPLFIYQTAFEFFDMGRAAAMSVFLFAGVMIFSFVLGNLQVDVMDYFGRAIRLVDPADLDRGHAERVPMEALCGDGQARALVADQAAGFAGGVIDDERQSFVIWLCHPMRMSRHSPLAFLRLINSPGPNL